MADIKSMTLEQARSYRDTLKGQGKSESTSKEYAKVADYIKVMKEQANPGTYGAKELKSSYEHLSRGVTETGGWTEANLDNIEKYTGKRPVLKDPNAVTDYLGGYQDTLYNNASNIELRDSIVNQLEPKGGKPETLNRVKEFENMREQYGVADLETQLTGLKTDLETEISTKRKRTNVAEGGQVAMGVIAGRVGEIERQENERIDVLNRTINTITDQLNTSYNVIQTYINYMGMDYNDAVEAYNTEFNRNLQIYNLVQDKIDKQQAAARSNLQIMTNAITSGNINYNTLSGDQKALINKLELQSGLPVGFTSKISSSEAANGKIISTTTRESGGQKYVDVVYQRPDGGLAVKSQSLGAYTAGNTGDTNYGKTSDKYLNDATDILKSQDTIITGKFKDAYGEPMKDTADQKLSREEMAAARSQIISLVGDEAEGKALFNRAMNAGGYGIWEGN